MMKDIIERKEYKYTKCLTTKEVVVPTLLVLAVVFLPIIVIIMLSLWFYDSEWGSLLDLSLPIFIWIIIALALYIKEHKCFKLIRSLFFEVICSFSLLWAFGSADTWNVGLVLLWLLFFVLYIIFWFYRVFKAWTEWDLENKKWYNKWRIRIILVVAAWLLLWLLASFLTVQCTTHNGFICNWFKEFMSNYTN